MASVAQAVMGRSPPVRNLGAALPPEQCEFGCFTRKGGGMCELPAARSGARATGRGRARRRGDGDRTAGPGSEGSLSPVPELSEVIAALDALWPPGRAEQWDAVGTVCGDVGNPEARVERVLFAVDPVQEVADEAVPTRRPTPGHPPPAVSARHDQRVRRHLQGPRRPLADPARRRPARRPHQRRHRRPRRLRRTRRRPGPEGPAPAGARPVRHRRAARSGPGLRTAAPDAAVGAGGVGRPAAAR